MRPVRTLATASPPDCPGYQASRIAAALAFAQLRLIGLPFIATTTSGLPVGLRLLEQCALVGRKVERGLVAALEAGKLDGASSPSRSEVSPTTATMTSACGGRRFEVGRGIFRNTLPDQPTPVSPCASAVTSIG